MMILDIANIPTGTNAIQYYIQGKDYVQPVMYYTSIQNYKNQTYPFTSKGDEYTIKVLYIGSSEGQWSNEVTKKATGGIGDLKLGTSTTAKFVPADKAVEISPSPSFDLSNAATNAIQSGKIQFILCTEDESHIWYYYVNSSGSDLDFGTTKPKVFMSDFEDYGEASSDIGSRKLENFEGEQVLVKCQCLITDTNGDQYIVELGKTEAFEFDYFNY